jgi:hypothetical protein
MLILSQIPLAYQSQWCEEEVNQLWSVRIMDVRLFKRYVVKKAACKRNSFH